MVKEWQRLAYDNDNPRNPVVVEGTTWYCHSKAGMLEHINYDTPASAQDMKFSYDVRISRGAASSSCRC